MSAQILGIAATFMPWDTTDQMSSPVPLMSQGLSIHRTLHEKRQSIILHSFVSILLPIQARESMTLPTRVLVGCLPSWLHSVARATSVSKLCGGKPDFHSAIPFTQHRCGRYPLGSATRLYLAFIFPIVRPYNAQSTLSPPALGPQIVANKQIEHTVVEENQCFSNASKTSTTRCQGST